MRRQHKKFKMVEHEIAVRVAEDVHITTTLYAPDNMAHWKLTRLAAQKLGLIERPPRKGKSHHSKSTPR